MDVSSGSHGILQLYEAQQAHAMVHRQHRLPSYSSPECAHPVLSTSQGDGGNSRASITCDDNTIASRYSCMLPLLLVGRRAAGNGLVSRSGQSSVAACL